MMAGTQVIRSATGMVFGTTFLVVLALAPAGVLYLTDSLVASIAFLVVALLFGVIIFTLMSAHRLTFGPAGVFVVADDDNHTLAWNSIEKFDYDRFWVSDGNRGWWARGLVIRLRNGPDIRVDWINTKRTIGRLNEALAKFGDRDCVPQISAKPLTEVPRLTMIGFLAAFNIGVLRLMKFWPIMFLVGIMVNILVICVYMGVKMSKGE